MLQVIRILSLIGLWLSGLSLYEFLTVRSGVAGLSICKIGAQFDCAAVAQSTWSVFFGLPLASWGITFYLGILLFTIVGIRGSLVAKETVSSVVLVLSFLASLFSIFLFSVSFLSIGKLCPVCIGMYFVNFLIFAASLKLVGSLGLHAGLKYGFSNLFKAPKLIFGIGGSSRQIALARLGATTIALILFSTSVAEDVIQDKLIIPQIEVNQTIAAWSAQPKHNIQIQKEDFALGKEDAPIQIVEFSDFQCPACRRFYTRFEPLLMQYKDKIHFVFKNFPLDDYCNSMIDSKFHEHACYAANVARCAGEQGKFWEMVEYLNHLTVFDDESANAAVREEIQKGLGSLGLDQSAVQECIKSERQLGVIKADVKQGIALGIEGTPAIWINGQQVELSANSDLQALFDKILKDK